MLLDVVVALVEVSFALSRLHRRLSSKTKLYKLHLKHSHMNSAQFMKKDLGAGAF